MIGKQVTHLLTLCSLRLRVRIFVNSIHFNIQRVPAYKNDYTQLFEKKYKSNKI